MTTPDKATYRTFLCCEFCGAVFERTQPKHRFCSRRCQNNAYHAERKANDPAFHARALEYQRLYRIREKARNYGRWELFA